MLQAVARTPFFGDVALRAVIWHLKQVRRYLSDPTTRQHLRQTVLDAIADDTRVLVAHSLGSVAAYETLCAQLDLPVRTLVTLGSPLGVGPLGTRLEPRVARGAGVWPSGIRQWFNIADRADVVAVEKTLGDFFGTAVVDRLVHNGATAHDAQPYLTAVETGCAIKAGVADVTGPG
jgi:pimeloyl-ACP methyl ester carboxylesterase